MTIKKSFPEAGFLDYLESLNASGWACAYTTLPPLLARMPPASGNTPPSQAGEHLMALLRTRRIVLEAAFDAELVADELRRYQKFAKPGQPSPHIVGLRRKQAAARQAGNVARQSFVKAAAAFVREAGLTVPQHMTIEVFIDQWIDANVPKAFVPPA